MSADAAKYQVWVWLGGVEGEVQESLQSSCCSDRGACSTDGDCSKQAEGTAVLNATAELGTSA